MELTSGVADQDARVVRRAGQGGGGAGLVGQLGDAQAHVELADVVAGQERGRLRVHARAADAVEARDEAPREGGEVDVPGREAGPRDGDLVLRRRAEVREGDVAGRRGRGDEGGEVDRGGGAQGRDVRVVDPVCRVASWRVDMVRVREVEEVDGAVCRA